MKTVENDLKLVNNIYKARNTHTRVKIHKRLFSGDLYDDGWFCILGS